MNKLVRALGAVLGAFAVTYLVGLGLTAWWTSDPTIVRPEALTDGTTAAVNETMSSGEQSAAAEAVHQSVAYDGLMVWTLATAILVASILLVWALVVFFREKKTFGPASQSSARLPWLGLMFLYMAGSVAAFFWLVVPMDLVRTIFSSDIYVPGGVISVVGAAAIWVGSILGIGPVLRPSVPLGARRS